MDRGGENIRVIISGGGTGGHIFPAVSIADALRRKYPEVEILFVGAEGRMEMQRVPSAGYRIVGLPICGLDRRNLLRNFAVAFKFVKSGWMARKIIKNFHPDVAIGVGGYASGPTLKAASMMGIPTLIQEQNSYAGVTNKMLARGARRICVAYEGMERFFPKEKIMLTGNPIRKGLTEVNLTRDEGIRAFGLDPAKRTVLVIGGSLGARTMNESILRHLDIVKLSDVQFIWQTGKYYYKEILEQLNRHEPMPMLCITDFISRMDEAYAAADLVISRAGAGSISEFCVLGKPVILVPSPNVAEDHQTQNALALVRKRAALYVKDTDAPETLLKQAIETVKDPALLTELGKNIATLAYKDAADVIAEEVYKLAKAYKNER